MADTNKILTIFLVVIICIAAVVLLYVNLPKDETTDDTTDGDTANGDTDNNQTEEPEEILSIQYNQNYVNYTLEELETFQYYIANGTMIKTGWLPEVVLEGPNVYTGIKMTILLNEVNNLPDDYTISVLSSDNKTIEFNISEIQGNVDIYNETGNITGNTGVTMILAYKKDGEYLNRTEEGYLRIVFVDDDKITASNLWAKKVVTIIINDIE